MCMQPLRHRMEQKFFTAESHAEGAGSGVYERQILPPEHCNSFQNPKPGVGTDRAASTLFRRAELVPARVVHSHWDLHAGPDASGSEALVRLHPTTLFPRCYISAKVASRSRQGRVNE